MNKINLDYLGTLRDTLRDKDLTEINKDELIPNHAYLFFYIADTEGHGNRIYYDLSITAGYYVKTPDRNIITLSDAISMDSTQKGHVGRDFDIKDILKYVKDYVDDEQQYNIEREEQGYLSDDYYSEDEHSMHEEEGKYTTIPIDPTLKIYKLPNIPPLHNERIPGMRVILKGRTAKVKKALDELKLVPIDDSNISFIGKEYRKTKKRFEKKQGKRTTKSKGGYKKKSHKRKTISNKHKTKKHKH